MSGSRVARADPQAKPEALEEQNLRLRHEIALLRAVVEGTTDAIFVKDAEGRYVLANGRALSTIGLPAEEVIGKTDVELFPAEVAHQLRSADQEILATGEARLLEEATNGASGPIHWHSFKGPYQDESGRTIGLIGIARDITVSKLQEKELQDREEALREVNIAMSNAMPGISRLDTEGTYLEVNDAYASMLGYQPAEMIGTNWERTVHEEDISGALEGYRAMVRTGKGEFEARAIRADGSIFFKQVLMVRINDESGRHVAHHCFMRDVTERKQAEQALQESEQRYRSLFEQLRASQEELLRKERLATLGQLTATVSHELRNPLGAMSPSLFLLRKRTDPDDVRTRQALDRLERGISRCDHIIDELLDFTRMGKLDLKTTAIDPWLSALLDELDEPEGVTVDRELTLTGLRLDVDRDRLRRAVINVYENACQAKVREMRLTVATRSTEKRVELSFTDTGSGIARDVLSRIFEPLFSTKGFGIGLGLPTVRSILEQHGGGIEVETEDGSGTCMVLWLPRAAEPVAPEP